MELIDQEILECRWVPDWGVVDLGGGDRLSGGDALALSCLQFKLDALLFGPSC